MTKKTLDIQQTSVSISDLLSLLQDDNAEILLTSGDEPLAKVIPISSAQKKIIPQAGLNLGSMVMNDNFDEPLPDEFWLS